jgi:hypothetical protein
MQLLLNSWNLPKLNMKFKLMYKFMVDSNKISSRINFLKKEFKFLGTQSLLDNVFSSQSISNNNFKPVPLIHTYGLLRTFKTFLFSNTSSNSILYTPHSSFSAFYLNQFNGGSSVLNIGKFFKKWKLSYFLLYNLFFYKISLLVFTPSFLKSENLAINWAEVKQIKFTWRYIRPFLTFKPNKINDYGEFIFRQLKTLGMNIGLVTDVLYHNKSIYYLNRLNFYTIGTVPTIYNAHILDFAVPTVNTSLISQVFFIRFVVQMKRVSASSKLSSLQHLL